MTKICFTCKVEKDSSEFNKCLLTKDRLSSSCRICKNKRGRYLRSLDPEKYRIRSKKWRDSHLDKARESSKKYYAKNRDKKREYQKANIERRRSKHLEYERKRMEEDIQYKLAKRLRARLYHAIKKNWKAGSAVEDLGCSIEEFMKYMELKFIDDMSWENYGKWHIDHIIPLTAFDLSDREQLLKACHFQNLQPLWGSENIRKSNHVALST